MRTIPARRTPAPPPPAGSPMDLLSQHPELLKALRTDRAIRLSDGRWSGGFLNMDAVPMLVAKKVLKMDLREGVTMIVPVGGLPLS